MAKSNLSQSVRTILAEKIRQEKGAEARNKNIRAFYGKKRAIERFVQRKKDEYVANKIMERRAAKAAAAAA